MIKTVPVQTTFAQLRLVRLQTMRYFLRDGAEAIRIRAGRSETAACGRQVFTDPKTGEES